jgi:hypothetical protein
LRVLEGVLEWRNEQGGVLLRLPLEAVESVVLRYRFEPGSIVILGLAAGLAWVGWAVSESNWLTTLLYVAAILLGAIGLFGVIDHIVVIRSWNQTLRISCKDAAEEAAGFVMGLQTTMQGKSS